MKRHPPVVKNLSDSTGGRLTQMRAALGQAVQKFGQHFVSRNQVDFPKHLPSADYVARY